MKVLYCGAVWPKMDTEPKMWGTNSHKNKEDLESEDVTALASMDECRR